MKETHNHAVKRGKKSRASGKRFELKVREDLESKDWIVVRFDKNVDYVKGFNPKNMLGPPYYKEICKKCGNVSFTYAKRDNIHICECKGKEFIYEEQVTKEDVINGYTKLIQSKPKFNPFTKNLMMNSSGFPDFIIYRWIWNCNFEKMLKEGIVLESTKSFPINGIEDYGETLRLWEIVGIECKSNGILDKEEKEKCKWLLNNHIFATIFIAKKEKRGIKYVQFRV